MRKPCSTFICVVCLTGMGGSTCKAEETPPPAVAPFNAEEARKFQRQWGKHLGTELIHTNSIGMKLVLLPPGEFTMGLTEERFDEALAVIKNDPKLKQNYLGTVTWSMLMMPAHRVRITKPLYMGAYEVTVAQFRQFAEASGYLAEAERGLNHGKPITGGRPISTWRKPMAWRKPPLVQNDDEPVLHLCWNDCVAFCKWLSEKEGREYHLPTEAQWEYACRAGTTSPWHFGERDDFERVAHEYAWWSDGAQEKHDRPRSVGRGKQNAFGLYDMHGNVWEYVGDWWHRLTYKESPLNDPTGPAVQSEKNDQRRIIRGSSFDWGRWGGDSAYRMRITQRSTQHPHMGFRVALSIEGATGVPPAVDPHRERRRKVRDPGADAEKVVTALKSAAGKDHARKLTVDLGSGVKMEFVLIPAGSFLMGSAKGPNDERPIHRVVISKPFYMARHEVTQQQWEAMMGVDNWLENLRKEPNDLVGPRKAMYGVSWNDCRRFIAKLKQQSPEWNFALPTEAQWEYACRAGSTTEYHFGDDESELGQYAHYAANKRWPAEDGSFHYYDVATKRPNRWGLYDMHGGMWEWCADRYDADYYFDSPLVDPAGPESGRFRVLRGGSWFRYGKYARSAYRRFFHPESGSDAVTAWINDFGCRPVINLDDAGGKNEQTTHIRPTRDEQILRLAETLVKHQGNPVLDTGEKGTWDERNCGCFSVAQFGGRLHLYYMGSGSRNPWRIGLATSDDGIEWKRSPANPVLPQGPPGSWDDRQVSMPWVLAADGKLCMWYSGSGHTQRVPGGFGLATSTNGVNWKRHGNGPVFRGTGGSMDPCVRKFDGRFVMWYAGKQEESFRIFRATSPDGIQWTRRPGPVLPLGRAGDFDEKHHAGPVVLRIGERYCMFYLGGSSKGWRMGLATSADGVVWKKSAANPILDVGGEDAWDGGSILSHDVLFSDGRFHVWYAAHPAGDAGKRESDQAIRIGYAMSERLGGTQSR